MAKVTSKLQITLPKAVARQYGIQPGDEVTFQPSGEQLRLVPKRSEPESALSVEERLRLFDEASERIRSRLRAEPESIDQGRDWNREELYGRGLSP